MTPVTAKQVKEWTDKDPILSKVRTKIQQGDRTPDDNPQIQPYVKRIDELSTQDGCLMWGTRIVIPQAGQEQVLTLLHEGHPGILRMKRIARGMVWWPNIDAEIETKVKDCESCQLVQKTPTTAPLHPWEWPNRPWSRIHIDHAGPFMGKIFLVLVDAHSKWMDVHIVPSTNSSSVISILRSTFATHGLPEVVVSDNGSAFTSLEFRTFLKKNGIKQITSAPYHPATNGLAERAVQTVKNALKKGNTKDLPTTLARFLFHYRTTPHSTTGLTPAEMLMGRPLRTHLDLLKPDIKARVETAQEAQKRYHDKRGAKNRSFSEGDQVFVQNFGAGPKWIAGTVTSRQGPLTYKIELENRQICRRHIDHIRTRTVTLENTPTDNLPPIVLDVPGAPESNDNTNEPMENRAPDIPLRRSTRFRQPPNRYTPTPQAEHVLN